MSLDLTRQVTVTVAAIACALGTLFGFGLIGTRVEESAGGALAADATLIAPAGPAFSIWSVIYLALLGYVIWQWLPANRESGTARATGYWVAASLVLNGAWLLVTQFGWLWVSVAVIATLAVVLKIAVARLDGATVAGPGRGVVEQMVTDGTLGLYLGWVAVAVCANVAATLVESGLPAEGTAPEFTTVALLILVAVFGIWYQHAYGGRLAIAAAMSWGLGWIAYGRLTGEPASTLVGVAAALAAVVIAGYALLRRFSGRGYRV